MKRMILSGVAIVVAFVLVACAVPNGGGRMMKGGANPDQSGDRPPDAPPAAYEGGRK